MRASLSDPCWESADCSHLHLLAARLSARVRTLYCGERTRSMESVTDSEKVGEMDMGDKMDGDGQSW